MVATIFNPSGHWVATVLLCTLSDSDIQLALDLNYSIVVGDRVISDHIWYIQL